MTRKLLPLPPEARLDYIRRTCALIAEQEAMLWDVVQSFLDTGSSPDDLAHALGMSRATLHRRLGERRDFLAQE